MINKIVEKDERTNAEDSEALGAYLSGAGATIMIMLKKDDNNTQEKLKKHCKEN